MWFDEWMRESGCRIRNGSLWSVAQVESGEGRLERDGTRLGWRMWWTEHEHRKMCYTVGTRCNWWLYLARFLDF